MSSSCSILISNTVILMISGLNRLLERTQSMAPYMEWRRYSYASWLC